jgi:hypothetical protein
VRQVGDGEADVPPHRDVRASGEASWQRPPCVDRLAGAGGEIEEPLDGDRVAFGITPPKLFEGFVRVPPEEAPTLPTGR